MVADPDSGPDLNPPTRLGQDVLGHWPSIPHSHLHEIVSKGLCSAKGLVILGNMNASNDGTWHIYTFQISEKCLRIIQILLYKMKSNTPV